MSKTLERTSAMKAAKPVSKEELELAAYFHWLNRGCPANDDLTDWIEAEKVMAAAIKLAPKLRPGVQG